MKYTVLISTLMVMLGIQHTFALWNGATDAATWTSLNNDLETVRTNLQAKMSEASTVGVDTSYASVSLTTINRFQTWAQFDRDHPDEIYTAVTNQWWADDFSIFPADYNVRLPFEEVQDCIELGNRMINELEDQIDGTIQLISPPDLTTGVMAQGADTWYRDGTPTFPSAFTWMPDDADFLDAFGNMGGVWYPLSELKSDGTVADWAWEGDVASLSNQNARGDAPHNFTLGSRVSSWMKTAYPDIEDGRRNFIQWDIDHPMIRTWVTQYVEAMFEHLIPASGDTPRIHNLANEPHFALGEKGWSVEYGISEHTKDKYGVWLEDKYTTVSNLNTAQGSSYTNFVQAGDELPFDMSDSNPKNWGVPKALQGTAVWYDVMRFNMDRVNEWFQFCSDVTQTNDPAGYGSNIKLTGWSFAGGGRDGGLDVEYLAKMQGVLGSDLNNASRESTNYRGKDESWKDKYTMKWEEQTMCLDFYRSIAPNKPFYDSEWHALDNEWKDIDMKPEYVRSAMWMAMTHGCSILDTWVWGRHNDGDFEPVNSSFIGELLTQPKVLDAYGRTMKEMNAHAESIVSVVPNDRQFLIYYCEESAIQDPDYVPDMTEVYMALKLLNIPMGFTTPTEIAGKTSAQTVIVPRTEFILDASLAALTNFAGEVVLVDPANCFTKTEHGVARGASGITPYGTIALSDDLAMASDLDTLLDPLKVAPPLQVDVMDASGQPAYGVFVQQSQDMAGDVTISLINAASSNRTVTVHLTPQLPELYDVINGLQVATNLVLAPYDVMLLSTAYDNALPQTPSVPVTMVLWGAPEGDMNICTGNVDGVGIPYNYSYLSGEVSTPAPGTPYYYPNTNGTSPIVNYSTSHVWPNSSVAVKDDATYGDHLYHGAGGGSTNMETMFVWENFLEEADALQTLTASLARDDSADANCYFRFIVQSGSGDWYASDERNVSIRWGFDAFSVDADTENWHDFTPITSGAASVGSSAFPDFSDVQAVGLYMRRYVTSGWKLVACRHFEVVGLQQPEMSPFSSWASSYGLGADPMNDEDYDGLINFGEYVFGGNPTNGDDVGVLPSFYGISGDFIVSLVGDTNVKAYVVSTTNLVGGTWHTNSTFSISEHDGAMHAYTNNVGTAEDHTFIKLLVE